MYKNLNNNFFNKEIFILFFLYLTLLISFILGENSTGGAINDYIRQKVIVNNFSDNFYKSLINYEQFTTRHSPVLISFLSIFEKMGINDSIVRLIHLHLCLLLPLFFFKCLDIKFKKIKNSIFVILISLIFISPTFRSLAIWPDSRILGLTFFTIGIYYFLKFEEKKKLRFAVSNVLYIAISSYISPNFCVFSLFFILKFLSYYKFFSGNFSIILISNLVLAIPAFYYVFILDINFFLKSAAIGINQNEKIIFNNLFNDVLINFTFLFFYIFPFLFRKIILLEKYTNIRNIIFTSIIFVICVIYFNYNYLYGGGGIIFKASNFLFNNNYIFFIFSYISILVCLPLLLKNKYNILIFILITLNNPQYTLYHKYFDPFLLITFFTLFSLSIKLENIYLKKNYIYIFTYFIIFLLLSNFKYLWTI